MSVETPLEAFNSLIIVNNTFNFEISYKIYILERWRTKYREGRGVWEII